MTDNLKKKTTVALIWSFIDKMGQQVLYFISGIILARLLDPTDYGKVGVLAVFISMSTIMIDSGFGTALIRKKNPTQTDYSTVFYFNLFISLIFYLILFATAPYIALFFGIPDLEAISRILFLAFVFYAIGLIQQTRLMKQIAFTQLAQISILALFISSVIAIVLALKGFGVWALVAQTVGLAFFRTLFLWIFGKWTPAFIFKLSSLKEFLSYSSNLIATGLLNAIFNNLYSILIGKVYGSTSSVGYYTQANKFQEIPSGFISNMFRSVAFPVLSSINDDIVRLKRVFRKYIRTAAFFLFPIMTVMILIANPLVLKLLTEKWLPSVPYLQILCIAGAFSPFIILFYDLLNTLGRSDINLRMELIKKGCLVVGILLIFQLGIIALIWLWVVYTLGSLAGCIYVSRRYVEYGYREFLGDIAPALFLSIVSAAIPYLSISYLDNLYLQLFIPMGIFGICYLIGARLFHFEIYHECVNMVKAKLQKRGK